MDLDSTICAVCGKAKHGAGYGYTKELGYHPLVTRAGTGELLHVRMRKGRPTPSGEPSGSSKNWWPDCVGQEPPVSWSCASTRGSGRMPPSPPSDV